MLVEKRVIHAPSEGVKEVERGTYGERVSPDGPDETNLWGGGVV